MALQFHIHVATAIDRHKLLQRALRLLHAAVCQSACQQAFLSASYANQSGRKFGEIIDESNSL
jgi:hypothetical protein